MEWRGGKERERDLIKDLTLRYTLLLIHISWKMSFSQGFFLKTIVGNYSLLSGNNDQRIFIQKVTVCTGQTNIAEIKLEMWLRGNKLHNLENIQ